MRIHLCTTIGASVESVWRTVENIPRHTEWMVDAESITFVTDQRAGIGTEFDCVTRVGPFRTVDRMRVAEWETNAVMGIEHRGMVTGAGRFTLHTTGAGVTRFCWDEDLRFPVWMGAAIGERAGRPILRAIWRANLRRLRALAESDAAGDDLTTV